MSASSEPTNMNGALTILLLGSGGREHALAWKLAQSPRLGRLLAAPGNPGIAAHATLLPGVDIADGAAVCDAAIAAGVDLVVIGPEAPLAAGVADACRAAGIAVFGPSAAAARLEASKAFTKELCAAAGVPTAAWARFACADAAIAHARAGALPVVVKADGLMAGKGVVIAASHRVAETAIADFFAAGQDSVLVEEWLEGPEASFFVLADGEAALPLIAAQDHKRLLDGDRGPNTGGMGAFAPASLFTPAIEAEVMERIIRPTLAEMVRRGTPFSGVLFAGLMLTADGPKLIEYNVRFGDPECQVLMLLLESDLVELLWRTATGRLAGAEVRWIPEKALSVVMAAPGYPGRPVTGIPITGLDTAGQFARVFHAGTALRADGTIISAGGRVLAVTAAAADLDAAAGLAYAAVGKVGMEGAQWRRDIGWRERVRPEKRGGEAQ
jgi:phosphoribosylamine--glycine ligase